MRAAVVLVFIAVVCSAQTKYVAVGDLANANLPAQRIGPDDLLSIAVYDSPELTKTVRVSQEGDIQLPMLKSPIKADTLFPRELEKQIVQALVSSGLLVDPVVTVTVVEYRSRPISVAGAVRKPITFQAYGGVTLMEAITRAEGLAPEAGADILVTRSEKDADGTAKMLTRRIPVKALFEATDASMNMKLSGGEEISVPEVGKIYVAGNVKKPGVFALKDTSGTTVLKVLALAEGLAPFAGKDAYIYRHEATPDGKNEILVELRKIVDRKAPDVTLQPDDIFYIPDNRGRRLTISALEKLVGFGSSTASGILIWGR